MERSIRIVLFALISIIAISLIILGSALLPKSPRPDSSQVAAIAVASPFTYIFKVPGTLYESASMHQSTSPYWWLNSGGKLIITGTSGQTIQGDLPLTDRWRALYNKANPIDTDLGAHPQNLFRLVSRNTWNDVSVAAQFKIVKDNLSVSSNRNASNGLLLMSRYARDGQTLYYAGVRVDGTAVIKKKYDGKYFTMAQKKVFDGTYDASDAPNLLPHGEWIGLRSDTKTLADGTVRVTLSMQREGGAWQEILTAIDDGVKYGKTPSITGTAHVGIRTDFMDVQFKNYRAESI